MFVAMKRKLHVSVLIGWACVGVVAGVFLAAFVDWRLFVSFAWFLLAAVLFAISCWRRSLVLVPVIVAAGVLFGLWRGAQVQQQLGVYDNLIGYTVTLSGTVAEDADTNARGQTILRLRGVQVDTHPASGQVWVALDETGDIRRGDRVSVRGKLTEGFGSFAVAMYSPTLTKVERPDPGDVALRVRDWFGDAVRRVIPEPQASLGLGYLVGQRRGLPSELDQALQIAGLTHIIVASGYNLTILVRFARRLFEKVSKYVAALSSTLMISGFIAVTGMSPSMSRAGLVAGLSLLAWYYGRKFHPLVLLPFAAAITLVINPAYAWGDLGWLLSFAAFAGVMIVAPLLQAYFFGNEKPGTIRQIVGETFSAQLVTLPIIIVAFGSMSNVALVANLLVLPLVPLAMILVFTAGLASLIVPLFAPVIALPAAWLLEYMVTVAKWLAGLPWAQVDVSMSAGGVVVAYVSIALICVYMQRKTQLNLRDTSIID